MVPLKLQTDRFVRSIEATLEIITNLTWVFLVFFIFKWITNEITTDSNDDILISMLLLPSIYIIKDSSKIIAPWFVTVYLNESSISSVSGFAPQIDDTLSLSKVDNIEIQVTPLGKVFNYGTIKLYSAGGAIELPNVKNYLNVKNLIEEKLKY